MTPPPAAIAPAAPAVSAGPVVAQPADDSPVEIVAGAVHTCARTAAGRVVCWGAGRTQPAYVAGLAHVAELAAGEQHTCARLGDGGVVCWDKATAPVRVDIDHVVAITAGRDHTCALRSDHSAWCWGANDGWQAADGSNAKVIEHPVRAKLDDVVEVRAGEHQTCARTRDRRVWCWGDRDALRGQALRPLAAVDGVTGVDELAVGLFSACARVGKHVRCWPGEDGPEIVALDDIARLVGADDRYCVVTSKRAVSCWTGSFGYTHLHGVTRMPSLDGADQIALGRYHSCALRAGVISCSGENREGQLGNGTQGFALAGVRVPGMHGVTSVDFDYYQAPCAVIAGEVRCVHGEAPKLHDVVEIADHCARLASGVVMCWGDNRAAQLGRDEPQVSEQALPVPGIAGATSLTAFAARRCAVVKSRVVCWGNEDGVSIHDLSEQKPRLELKPVELPGIRDATAVSLGFLFGCALLKNKTVTCWQMRDYDAGTVTRYAQAKPKLVPGLTDVVQISVGRDTAGAVRADGSIVLWGLDLKNGLSDLPPTRVAGVTDAAEVVVRKHACMRHRDGRVSCWGRFATIYGVLIDSPTPVPIAGITSAVGLASGGDHDCARLADGDLACWGENHQQELGVPLGEEAPPTAVTWPRD